MPSAEVILPEKGRSVFPREIVIVLVGKPAAGKSTVASILAERWQFKWIKTREIVLALSGPSTEKTSLQELGKRLMTPAGTLQFAEAVKDMLREGHPAVIDSIRPMSHYTTLVRTLNKRIYIVAVIAGPDRRRERFQRRSGEGELEWEARNRAEVESEVPQLVELADYVIANQSEDMLALSDDVDRMVNFLMREDQSRRAQSSVLGN